MNIDPFTLQQLNRQLQQWADEQNSRPIEEFDGRSPNEMRYMINEPFHKNSPLKFRPDVSHARIAAIPFVRLMDAYLRIIEEEEPLKLTRIGNLPPKIVRDLYGRKILTEEMIESGFQGIHKETDSNVVHRTRVIADITKFTSKMKNKLHLTRKGREWIGSDDMRSRFETLFITYTTVFNWSYFDRYEGETIGQLGFAFIMEQLSRYGKKERPASYYSEKYLRAFPHLAETCQPSWCTLSEHIEYCFTFRTLEGFMHPFGLIEMRYDKRDPYNRTLYIRKTPLLDKLFRFA